MVFFVRLEEQSKYFILFHPIPCCSNGGKQSTTIFNKKYPDIFLHIKQRRMLGLKKAVGGWEKGMQIIIDKEENAF